MPRSRDPKTTSADISTANLEEFNDGETHWGYVWSKQFQNVQPADHTGVDPMTKFHLEL